MAALVNYTCKSFFEVTPDVAQANLHEQARFLLIKYHRLPTFLAASSR